MNTTMHHARTENVNGTSLKGYVTTTYNKLVEAFGHPCRHEPPTEWEKVTIEWKLAFGEGVVATIYDWKCYGWQPTGDTVYDWHIGGYTPEAVSFVKDALGI